MYLSALIQTVPVIRKKVTAVKPKKVSRNYFITNTEGEKLRVCLNFFLATFCISHRVIGTCMNSIGLNGLFVGKDKRINHNALNKTSTTKIDFVKEHINSFPRVESHYCRKDTSKLYLPSDLNKAKMYRLYKHNFCTEKNISPVSLYVYSKIFDSFEPQLSFFIPKKDQCFLCNAYYAATDKTEI